MLTRRNYLLMGVVILATYTSATILTPCDKADDRVADEESCTQYHICREDPDSTGAFISDIAICPSMHVFDMITSTCVEVNAEDGDYLQDPADCYHFYGCSLPRQTSEGYLRTQFKCPGGLRFDPENRFCTHATSVPDTKCNSHVAVQAILGTVEPVKPAEALNTEGGSGGEATPSESASSTTAEESAPSESETASASSEGEAAAGSESSGLSGGPETSVPAEESEAPADETLAPDEETAAPAEEIAAPAEVTEAPEVEPPAEIVSIDTDASANGDSVFRVVTPGERPAKPLTDIDKIAQVIKGQLLTRRKASEATSKL